MTRRQGGFRVGVDIGGTFIYVRWFWFVMASASDHEFDWVNTHWPPMPIRTTFRLVNWGTLRSVPGRFMRAIWPFAQILSRFEVRGVPSRKRYQRSGAGISAMQIGMADESCRSEDLRQAPVLSFRILRPHREQPVAFSPAQLGALDALAVGLPRSVRELVPGLQPGHCLRWA